jgi:hypothetical protein
MGYSVFLEAMLQIALCLFPLFEGSPKRDADMKGSQNDPEGYIQLRSLGSNGDRWQILTIETNARHGGRAKK